MFKKAVTLFTFASALFLHNALYANSSSYPPDPDQQHTAITAAAAPQAYYPYYTQPAQGAYTPRYSVPYAGYPAQSASYRAPSYGPATMPYYPRQMPFSYMQNRAPYMQPPAQPYAYSVYPAGTVARPVTPQIPAVMPQGTPTSAAVNSPVSEYSGYLGISVDVIPSSVAAQMPEGTSQAQGILVKGFAADSPAETSDLKAYDVIVAFDKTPITHPAQFIDMVRKEKPGNTVTLQITRKGNLMDVPVVIGAQKTPDPKDFNSLMIKQTGNDQYSATIRFIAANGSKQFRTFEGSREEIFEQAMMANDLPSAERQQLLFATQPRKGDGSKTGIGSFMPFGKNESGKEWMNPGRFFKW